MNKKLIEVFNKVAIDRIFYPMGAISVQQNDLMYELGNLFDNNKLDKIFEGKSIKIWDSDIFEDWMDFNDWISSENVAGIFASLHIPIIRDIELSEKGQLLSSSYSFGICHGNFIYYENEAELIEKANKAYNYWRQYDIDLCKKKLENSKKKEI